MMWFEKICFDVMNKKALALYEKNGAKLDWNTQHVLWTVQFHKRTIKIAFLIYYTWSKLDRNRIEIGLFGCNTVNCISVFGLNSSDLEGWRRTRNFEYYCNFFYSLMVPLLSIFLVVILYNPFILIILTD